MSHQEVRDQLRRVALFRGLDGSDLERILSISDAVMAVAGECVFEEGERGDSFFIIVRGAIELTKRAGTATQKLAVLREGQAFGEMALLNQTPRSASAHAVGDTYMLSVSREAFGEILGGESLAVRLLRNLSKALWATSVRLAAQEEAHLQNDTPYQSLAAFNRLLRSRLLPRVIPRVGGYELAISTLAPKEGVGSSVWDWFLLADGRPVLVIARALRADVLSAHRLAALRAMLRSSGSEAHGSLGALLSRVNRGFRAGWVEGLSGSVACGVLALADGAAEWASAGPIGAVFVGHDGAIEAWPASEPAIGELADHEYVATVVRLDRRDRIVALSEWRGDSVALARSVFAPGRSAGPRDALARLFKGLGALDRDDHATDLTGAVVVRAPSSEQTDATM